jgi:putative membrane-bound dehydrogenase-like protein
MHPSRTFTAVVALIFLVQGSNAGGDQATLRQVGVAKRDITPTYPVRLSGYAARHAESAGTLQPLFAKALAIGSDREGPAILITVDNTGVPATIRNEVVRRLHDRFGIDPAKVALCSSHSHAAPCLAGNLPTLFMEPIPPEHQVHIDRYTRELTDAIEQVAADSLRNRQPSKILRSQSKAGFAANRRTTGGPVDHDLPILVVTDAAGAIRAILASYACHCTTLGSDTNQVCGDWAGYAQQGIENDFPGAIALISIGCGADANPSPRGSTDFASTHGREIAASVKDALSRTLFPVRGRLECRVEPTSLPFDRLPTRADLERMASPTNRLNYFARVNLAKLDRGEKLLETLPYLVQAWNFGNDLAMVFLPGEVVVDYSIRLKKEFDADRLWVNAYANDVPCYIPSERILREGGYEGGDAMVYYDKPARLAPGVETRIVGAVHDLVPRGFLMDEHRAEFPPPRSPADSMAMMQTRAGLQVELVAAEPLIVDPVAIDWGADGKLWVVEMRDYPMGMDGKWKPGSRIKYLEATRGNGQYDKATVYLDDLPFATGVMAWHNGVLVCAAPDILYAEGVDHSGRAKTVKKVFTGFATDNYQARVNGLSLGLDNWIYGANGLLGGVIHGVSTGVAAGEPNQVDIRGRDFRMNPDNGAFEPASGLTQQGRVRDDWGNWFGCDNSSPIWQYPLPDHYSRRNPFVAPPAARVWIAGGSDPTLLHPISRLLERFNSPESANRVTSGCGIGIYRDLLMGNEFNGDAFLCEPVHNLVHRMALHEKGATLEADRAPGEEQSEFLASKDNWFRPVQVRTGPDGGLWVVDMYRFVIEHPRWIPPERLAKLDVRAGEDKGRIYRVRASQKPLRPIRDLGRLSAAELSAALENPNGTERDRVHLELLRRFGQTATGSAIPAKGLPEKAAVLLRGFSTRSQLPEVRLQALCALDGLNALPEQTALRALKDPNPAVRVQAIRLCERLLKAGKNPGFETLVEDPDLRVRFQLALSLGESISDWAGRNLASLAVRDMQDPWMRAAILSSASVSWSPVFQSVLAADPTAAGRSEMIQFLIATAVGNGDRQKLADVLSSILPALDGPPEEWRMKALASALDALDRKGLPVAELVGNVAPFGKTDAADRLSPALRHARAIAEDTHAGESIRVSALPLLCRARDHVEEDLEILARLLAAPPSSAMQKAAADAIMRSRNDSVPKLLLAEWNMRTPLSRQAGLDVLLSRPKWTAELLDAVEHGDVNRNEIPLVSRQRLLKEPNPTLKRQAEKLWASDRPSARTEVLARYRAATNSSGDASKGAAIFSANCSQCHLLHGTGHAVGPDLAALADKSTEDFLTAILDPNAAVEPRFIAYNVQTRDGRTLTGVVSAETSTALTVTQPAGLSESLLKTDIQEIRASGLSLMPEGLEQAITPQALADLIAWIKAPTAVAGSAPGK